MSSSIKLVVTETSDYCGGAAPPEELITELKTPKPFSGILYIHQSATREDEGIEMTFVDGNATIEGLVPGTYYVFLQEKIDIEAMLQDEKLADEGVDIGCIHSENLKSVFSFEIEAKTKKLETTLHKKCNPCVPPAP